MKNRRIILTITISILFICIWIRNIYKERYFGYYLKHMISDINGLRAYYYDNPEWKGFPVFSRIEEGVYYQKDEPSDVENSLSEDFSIWWEGLLHIPSSGRYKFILISDDGSRLFLNGVPIIKNDGIHPAKKVTVRKYLRRGIYPIQIRYFQVRGEACISLLWKPSKSLGGVKGPIPLNLLNPVDLKFNRNYAEGLNRDVKRWGLAVNISFLIMILGMVNLWMGFYEKIYIFIISLLKNDLIAFVVLLLAFVFRLLFLGSVPGIDGDEAWGAIQSISFSEGREINLLRGLRVYTGPLFLLETPIFTLFGYNPITLRILPVTFNTLALLLCYMLVKRVYGKTVAIFSVITLSFWPITFMYSYWGLTAFSLFFLFLALYLIYTLKTGYLVLAGFILGLGVYNHLVFIAVPITLFLLGILETKGALILNRKFYLVLIPLLIVCSVRFLDIKLFGVGRIPPYISFLQRLYQLKHSIFFIFPKIIDGAILYKLFTGMVLINVFPINIIIFSICIVILCLKRNLIDRRLLQLILIVISTYFIISFCIPSLSPYYFVIPLTLLGLIPCILLGKIIKKSKRLNRLLAIIIICGISGVNIFYLCINYFYSYIDKKGECSCEYYKDLQAPIFIISHYYVDTRLLYNYLVRAGFNRVATNYWIMNSLSFWDIENNFLYCYSEWDFKGMPNECIIFYESGVPTIHPDLKDFGFQGLREIGDIKNFKIYVKENVV